MQSFAFVVLVYTVVRSYKSLSANMASKDLSSSLVSKKRKVYKCSYKVEGSKKYPITKSNGNPYAFYCVPCKKSVSCVHQGLSNLTAHCGGKIHKSFVRAIKTTRNMSSLKGFETEADTNLAGQTIRAEVMYTNFMVQHNISFLTAEYLSPL